MTKVSPKGVVQLKNSAINASTPLNKENANDKFYQQQDLPHWTLSAMKCLANWPKQIKSSPVGNETDEANFPSYPGFEQDVFEVVKDYFVGQMNRQGPLTTYKLFDIFVSAYIKAEAIGAKPKVVKRPEFKGILPLSGNQFGCLRTNKNFAHRPYTETDLDSGCCVQTSTPSSASDTQGYQNKQQLNNCSDTTPTRFFRMTSSVSDGADYYSVTSKRLGRVAKIRQTYEVCPNQPKQAHQTNVDCCTYNSNPPEGSPISSVSLSPDMSATAIMRNFLPPNT